MRGLSYYWSLRFILSWWIVCSGNHTTCVASVSPSTERHSHPCFPEPPLCAPLDTNVWCDQPFTRRHHHYYVYIINKMTQTLPGGSLPCATGQAIRLGKWLQLPFLNFPTNKRKASQECSALTNNESGSAKLFSAHTVYFYNLLLSRFCY